MFTKCIYADTLFANPPLLTECTSNLVKEICDARIWNFIVYFVKSEWKLHWRLIYKVNIPLIEGVLNFAQCFGLFLKSHSDIDLSKVITSVFLSMHISFFNDYGLTAKQHGPLTMSNNVMISISLKHLYCKIWHTWKWNRDRACT